MNRIYFYLYQFFSRTPNRDAAGDWAAAMTPLFFTANTFALWITLVFATGRPLSIRWATPILALATIVGSVYSYFRFEMAGRGKEVIDRFRRHNRERRDAIIGGLLFFEMLFGWLIPVLRYRFFDT